ncbi:MAG: hypothetical protein MSG64_17020 [Pyrinomonadaceae bacterium MAG19_C2-C3]|nr:hypothetical protein [Pyrinomonadaceae bacterium MAG19_C2-C3]
MGRGLLRDALDRLASDLDENGIDYTVIGAIALNLHGYTRATVDIDLLMTKEGLSDFHDKLVGLGYRPAFEGAKKSFRTTQGNLTIEIITAGEYPGDGLPKPVEFPEPHEHSVVIEGIKTLNLPKLVELKLASGISGAARLKDLADVQELIKFRDIKREFSEKLDSSVRAKFIELYDAVLEEREQKRNRGVE